MEAIMKAKIGVLILGLLLFGFYTVHSEVKKSEAFETNLRKILKEPSAAEFLLEEITTFDWSEMIVVPFGCEGECFDKTLGFDWYRIGRDKLVSIKGHDVWVFIDDESVSYYRLFPSDVGSVKTSVRIPRAQAKVKAFMDEEKFIHLHTM
jgi:hypothetical protein